MKIDLDARLNSALQGVNGDEQTVLVMNADNDADGGSVGIGVVGDTFVLCKMFATVLNKVKCGDAELKYKMIFRAIFAALYETFTIEEVRNVYDELDVIIAFKKRMQSHEKTDKVARP